MNDINKAESTIPDHLKKWLGENLLLGCSAEVLKNALLANGYKNELVEQELKEATSSPYLKSADFFIGQLKRREWFLKNLDYLRKHKKSAKSIPEIKMPKFSQFLEKYYYSNEPCIMRGATNDWPCAEKWNLEYLKNKIPQDSMVQVQHGREKDENYEKNADSYRVMMKFSEFVQNLQNLQKDEIASNDLYLTASNYTINYETLKPLFSDFAEFGDGFLDMRPETLKSDCRLWIGPKGIFTPYHMDTMNVMNIQAMGTKRFTLVPSLQVPFMYNYSGVYSEVDMRKPKLESFPDYKNITKFDIILEPGDALFIPVGWWHAVEGLTTSANISLINFNAPNDESFHNFPESSSY